MMGRRIRLKAGVAIEPHRSYRLHRPVDRAPRWRNTGVCGADDTAFLDADDPGRRTLRAAAWTPTGVHARLRRRVDNGGAGAADAARDDALSEGRNPLSLIERAAC